MQKLIQYWSRFWESRYRNVTLLAAVVLTIHVGRLCIVHADDIKEAVKPVDPPAAIVEVRHAPTAPDLTPRELLGSKLFYDTSLSKDGKRSCSTCHDPDHGFASHGRPTGIDGFALARRAPSLFGKAGGQSFFWDGRAATLEEQVIGPITNRKEMGNASMDEVVRRLEGKYGEEFNRHYRNGLTPNTLAHALAAYERTIQNPNTDLEKFAAGHSIFTREEAHGFELFRGQAGCYKCHSVSRHTGFTLTDESFHNTGLRDDDPGRYTVTRREEDRGKFKTPGLRGCSLTGPYMHDGSLKTLKDVVDFYDRGGDTRGNGQKDFLISPLGLTPEEKAALVAFLKRL